MRAALYARASTADQTTDNQVLDLRRYAEARGWAVTEYLDEGISGTKTRRPALDRLQADARRRRFDALIVWRLDRLGRDLKHLIMTLDGLTSLGIAVTS
jgi:DNA invertase Pin-like site-specific DNA recombinase